MITKGSAVNNGLEKTETTYSTEERWHGVRIHGCEFLRKQQLRHTIVDQGQRNTKILIF